MAISLMSFIKTLMSKQNTPQWGIPNLPAVAAEYELGKVKLMWLFQLNLSVKPKNVVTMPK